MKRVAAHKTTLTHEAVSRARPAPAPRVIWDDKLTGLGLRVSPGGTKSFFVQYRTGAGRRSDRNRKVTLGRFPPLSPAEARKRAQALLGAVRDGADPSDERARARALPRLGEAVDEWLRAKAPHLAESSLTAYRRGARPMLEGLRTRRLDQVTREDVAARFAAVSAAHGRVSANLAMVVLAAVYRRAVAERPGLRDPVARWKRAGGRLHRILRRRIDAPAEVLPAWARGIERGVPEPALRDVFWCALYTGLRVSEVLGLRWERVDLESAALHVEETKSGVALELPITRQLGQILARRREVSSGAWVFASTRRHDVPFGHPGRYYRAIERHGGRGFWCHALRNAFITVALHDLALPESLVKRLVNHAPTADVTEGYAAQWTLAQLREPAQRIADRLEALTASPHDFSDQPEGPYSSRGVTATSSNSR